jgi:hypothetical protein
VAVGPYDEKLEPPTALKRSFESVGKANGIRHIHGHGKFKLGRIPVDKAFVF